MQCPKCQTECDRDEVDIGVCVVNGPWGCHRCGWSEYYDLSNGKDPIQEDGSVLD